MSISINSNTELPPLILLDGGLGTTLADRYDVLFDESKPLWSSHLLLSEEGRKTLAGAQGAFVENGADVILSATYQASFEGFRKSGVEGGREAGRLMRKGVEIARAAADARGDGRREGGKVALSLGAYGATMSPGQEYSGRYDGEHDSVGRLAEWHFGRLGAFIPRSGEMGMDEEEEREREHCWESVDFVAFETLPRVDEVRAVREVMGRVNELVGVGNEKAFWVSCVFPGEGNVLPDGSGAKEVVEAMLGKGKGPRPMGVGINCTGVGKVESLVVEFESEIGRLVERDGGEWPSLVVYPDGTRGEVYDTALKEWVKSGGGGESLVSFPSLKTI